jgi:DUF4097 and DUF4098 domain-containing protein YvlB
MRQQPRFIKTFVTIAAAGIAAAGLSACDLVGKTFEDDADISQKITAVRLDSGNGSVTVRGAEGATKASVHREVNYKNGNKPGATTHVENGVLVLGGCGNDCSVGYTVDVPAGLPVTGRTSNGTIRLTKVSEAKVSTSNGSINLNDVTGVVDVRTTNGRISGHGLKGKGIDAQTSNGSIDLAAAAPQNVRAKTSNGRLAVTVPSARYRVSATTSNGSKELDVPNTPSGAYEIDLTTSNGQISLKSA